MEQIQIKLENYQKEHPAPHKRAFYVNETAKFLNKPFLQILGLTKKMSPDQINDLLLKAKSWNVNSQALWYKLRKEI